MIGIVRPLVVALMSMAGVAHAQWMPEINVSGFGTLAATHSSERNADFVTSRFQPNGVGATRPWSLTLDTRAGVQLDASFTEQFTGTLQLVSKQNADNSFRPKVEWANLKYMLTPDLSVRVGRIALPFYLHSETRQVGYAQPWVRPPVEVYILNPNTHSDGVDAMYRLQTGNVTHNLQAFYGKSKNRGTGGTVSRSDPSMGINDTMQVGDLTLRAAYTYSQVDVGAFERISAGFAGLSAIPGPAGREAARIAAQYTGRDMGMRTLAFGANYDPGNWFLIGEYLLSRGEGFLPGGRAWYVSGGYRIDAWTPYVTYAGAKNRTRSETGVPHPAATGLNRALLGMVANPQEQNTLTLGVRWDFARNMDLKAQYDRIDLDPNSRGRLMYARPGFQGGGNVNVFTLALDFVF